MKPGELFHGQAGSHQHLAYRIRNALNPIKIFGLFWTASEEEKQWAIDLLAKAYNDCNFNFIRGQSDGLKKLSLSKPDTSRDPRFFLFLAYKFLRRTKGILPFRNDTIQLTKRIWAITRLTQSLPELPLPDYKPTFQRKIKIEIDRLTEQKWSSHSKALGLEFSPAKRGPKPKSK
jgi:hypothetical protein